MAARARREPALASAVIETADNGPERLDTSFLESLVGYNARRAALHAIAIDMEVFAAHQLRVVDFSVLSVLLHNPGTTSRQLCQALGVLPPNMVTLLAALDRRGLLDRRPHPTDGRAVALHLSAAGARLTRQLEKAVAALESRVAGRLSAEERRTLHALLQRVYL